MKTVFLFLGITLTPHLFSVGVSKRSIIPRIVPVETVHFVSLGERQVAIKVLQYDEVKQFFYVNLHDNETTSVKAAKSILELKGGTLVKIENNEQRNVRFRFHGVLYTFDPNRIFSRHGIVKTIEPKWKVNDAVISEVEKFGKRILQLIPEKNSCVIALHNNNDGEFSIQTFMAGGARSIDAKAVYQDRNQDPDDFAFTTDNRIFQQMVSFRYNTIWQDNKNATRDGSLSIYCGEKNIRYVNIETEHGKTDQHREMLSKLISFITE